MIQLAPHSCASASNSSVGSSATRIPFICWPGSPTIRPTLSHCSARLKAAILSRVSSKSFTFKFVPISTRNDAIIYNKEKRHTSCSGVPFLSIQKTVCGFLFESEPPRPLSHSIESGNHNFITTFLPLHFLLLQ